MEVFLKIRNNYVRQYKAGLRPGFVEQLAHDLFEHGLAVFVEPLAELEVGAGPDDDPENYYLNLWIEDLTDVVEHWLYDKEPPAQGELVYGRMGGEDVEYYWDELNRCIPGWQKTLIQKAYFSFPNRKSFDLNQKELVEETIMILFKVVL